MEPGEGTDGGDESALLAQAHERARRLLDVLLGHEADLAKRLPDRSRPEESAESEEPEKPLPPATSTELDEKAIRDGAGTLRKAADAARRLAESLGNARRADARPGPTDPASGDRS